MNKKLPPPEVLHKLLRYNEVTGELFWKARTQDQFKSARAMNSWNAKNAGKAALESLVNGYFRGAIYGQFYFAHRVVFAMHHGHWPLGCIDHNNGIKCDNRPSNLVDSTNKSNSQNQKKRSTNKSGVTGVSWNKGRGNGFWVATIGGKHLGSFSDFEEATNVRHAAEAELGYSPRHGRS